MRTAEERIASLHTRMVNRRRWRERRTTNRLYAACVALALCLTALVFDGAAHPGGTAGVYTGAAMLFSGAGPYVLTAVVAFMLGVAVTALLRNRLDKQKTEEENG